jgi:Na+(H+)/acetate symporter ActP
MARVTLAKRLQLVAMFATASLARPIPVDNTESQQSETGDDQRSSIFNLVPGNRGASAAIGIFVLLAIVIAIVLAVTGLLMAVDHCLFKDAYKRERENQAHQERDRAQEGH